MSAKYVVFDGMDGSGKGTQIELLKQKLGSSVVFTREPGGTPFAEEIRKLVRDNPLAGESTPLNNFLLFWAAREELQQNLVVPSLQSGKHVISDRGDSSTFAFQIFGEQQRELISLFQVLRKQVFDLENRRAPDLYIFLDLPVQAARARVMRDVQREVTHFDERDISYYERVREGFRHFAKWSPVEFVDAAQSPQELHRSIARVLVQRLGREFTALLS